MILFSLMRIKSFTIIFLFSCAVAVAQEKLPVGKIKVSDGDTISVRFKNKKPTKVRLIGIDAPEMSRPFGAKCKSLLRKSLKGKVMEIENRGKDKYGRVLGRIIRDGEDVNLSMVKQGCAWLYENAKDLPAGQQAEYRKAFETARKERRGLFVKEKPENPADFRRRKRKPQK